MLYTRNGDSGHSGLFGTKERFPKDHSIYEALGTVDELNSMVGLIRARTVAADEAGVLYEVQERLFVIQALLAGADTRVTAADVATLEDAIERYEARIENPHAFVVPGATEHAAEYDLVRAVARRAERAVVRSTSPHLTKDTLAYLNRLSSLFYALARAAATAVHARETSPRY